MQKGWHLTLHKVISKKKCRMFHSTIMYYYITMPDAVMCSSLMSAGNGRSLLVISRVKVANKCKGCSVPVKTL